MKKILLLSTIFAVALTAMAQQQTDPTLPIPTVYPATNITEEGFDANWKAIPNELNEIAADGGYEVWAYVAYKADSVDNYNYINTDFNAYTSGSVDNHGEGGFSYGSLSTINRYGWFATNYFSIKSALALDGTAYGMMNACLMSPTYDLSKDNGNIEVEMKLCGREGVSYVTITLQQGLNIINQVTMPVSEDWETQTVTVPGGMDDCYLIIELDGNNQGYLFIDNLRISQKFQPGETASIPYSYSYTSEPTQDTMPVDTDELEKKTECYAYCMTTYGITEYSEEHYDAGSSGRSFYSDFVYVNAPSAITTTTVKKEETEPYWLSPNIYIQNSKKYLKK